MARGLLAGPSLATSELLEFLAAGWVFPCEVRSMVPALPTRPVPPSSSAALGSPPATPLTAPLLTRPAGAGSRGGAERAATAEGAGEQLPPRVGLSWRGGHRGPGGV